MSQQTSRPQKRFMSLFTEHIYVMQSKILSDMTNLYFKKFIYSSVDQVNQSALLSKLITFLQAKCDVIIIATYGVATPVLITELC